VGIIMDGNGRWAQARGLPRVAGHRAGTDNLRRILTAAVDFGVPILTLYAFSTENWGRPAAEVQALMLILRETLTNELPELHKNGVRIRHIGRKQPLDPALLEAIRHAEDVTRDNSRLVLNVALNYGGRADIVDACRAIVRAGIPAEQIDEAAISAHLSTAGLDDPDLIIRTAGEMRLSNFVIWQAAYAEYYSTPVYWPDFDRDAFYQALVAFQQRDRRFGKLNS
jgi:undecaprenyl diphosphate synthase